MASCFSNSKEPPELGVPRGHGCTRVQTLCGLQCISGYHNCRCRTAASLLRVRREFGLRRPCHCGGPLALARGLPPKPARVARVVRRGEPHVWSRVGGSLAPVLLGPPLTRRRGAVVRVRERGRRRPRCSRRTPAAYAQTSTPVDATPPVPVYHARGPTRPWCQKGGVCRASWRRSGLRHPPPTPSPRCTVGGAAAPSRGVPPRSVRRAATRQAAVARRARRRASARAGAVGAWVFWRPRSSLPAVALVGADRRAEQGGCGLRGLTSPNACADHAGGRRPGGAPARPRRVRRLFRASRRARPPGAGLSPRRWAGYGYVGRGATGRAPGDRPPRLRGRVGRRGAARERAGQTASQRRGGAAVWHQAAAEGGRRDGGRTVLDVRWCGGAGRAAAASTPNRNYTGEC